MAIVWSEEQPRERSATGTYRDGDEYQRVFLVRCNSLDTPLGDIVRAPGINYQTPHPDDQASFMKSYDTKVADDAGLLYKVTFKYEKLNPADKDDPGQPGGMEWKPPIWGGTSSVTTGPVYKNRLGVVMCNSAGDPLEGLEAEFAEDRLTLTQYYADHTAWMSASQMYTNAVNDAAWNGGAAGTWKCQGCSKKLNIETKDSQTIVYWEVTWEFAYRAGGWSLKPWDIGFNQRVDEEGVPYAGGTQRATITGQDGKGVRQPVALSEGVAKPAGEPPDELEFFVYEERDFFIQFGEVYTP